MKSSDMENVMEPHQIALVAAVQGGLIPTDSVQFDVLSALDDVLDVLNSGPIPEDYRDANILKKLVEIRGYVAGLIIENEVAHRAPRT